MAEPTGPEDTEGAADESKSAAPPKSNRGGLDDTLSIRELLVGLVPTVVLVVWFLSSQFSSLKDLIHEKDVLIQKTIVKVENLENSVKGLADRQDEIGVHDRAESGSPRIFLQASPDDLTYICEKLRGVYDFRKQYCDVEGRKVLYRFMPGSEIIP